MGAEDVPLSARSAPSIDIISPDRTGYARGTLATREGLSAAVPALDPRPLLTMEDMGMGGMGHDMAGMDHSQMGGMDNSVPRA